MKTSVVEDVENFKSFCTADGNVKWYSHCGKQHSMAISQKIKPLINIQSINSIFRYILKRIEGRHLNRVYIPISQQHYS
jgi:hypothetical protein